MEGYLGGLRDDFNPRLREGGDENKLKYDTDRMISIHASAKEATTYLTPCERFGEFQSTPPRRRRLFKLRFRLGCINFNPRLREGGDAEKYGFTVYLCLFQSTPPRRRRPASTQIPCIHGNFNPRLREGGDSIPTKENGSS